MQGQCSHTVTEIIRIYIEGKQQLCKFKPSMDLPIVRTAAALRAMFWLGFPWARSHKTPDMERPLVPYPKRSVRPCKTVFSGCDPPGSEGIRSQDKQYSASDYFKVPNYLNVCARCPTNAFGTGRAYVIRAQLIQVGQSNSWSITLKVKHLITLHHLE